MSISPKQKHQEKLTSHNDLSERVSELEAKLALTQQLMGVGFWEWDLKTNIFYGDQNMASMLGLAPEPIEKPIAYFAAFHDPVELEDILFHVNQHLQGKTESYYHRHRLKQSKEKWIWVLTRGKVTTQDEEGNPLKLIGSVIDITKQVQLETFVYAQYRNKLKDGIAAEQLKNILSTPPDPANSFLQVCSGCKKYLNKEGKWKPLEELIKDRLGLDSSHGICQNCLQELYGNEDWFKESYKTMFDSELNS